MKRYLFVLVVALLGCGPVSHLGSTAVSMNDSGNDPGVRDSGRDSGDIIRGCPGLAGSVPLLNDAAAVTVSADSCSVHYSQIGEVVYVSTLSGAPCHITASLGDGGATLSTTVTFQPVSGCPGSYRLSGDSGFADDAGK